MQFSAHLATQAVEVEALPAWILKHLGDSARRNRLSASHGAAQNADPNITPPSPNVTALRGAASATASSAEQTALRARQVA